MCPVWSPQTTRWGESLLLAGTLLLGISWCGSDADPASGPLQIGHLTIKLLSSHINWDLKRQLHVVHSVKAKAQSAFVELSQI